MQEHEPREPAPLVLTHDYHHEYQGYQNIPSRCRIRIYEAADRVPVVIATELDDNPGTSITNLAEQLAAEVVQQHFPERFEAEEPLLRWIEQYERTPDELRRRWPEFAAVNFARPTPRRVQRYQRDRLQLGQPQWTFISRAAVEALVGQPV